MFKLRGTCRSPNRIAVQSGEVYFQYIACISSVVVKTLQVIDIRIMWVILQLILISEIKLYYHNKYNWIR